MDACFLFIVLHVFLPIGGNSLDADSVFDILDSKINILDSKIENDVRTLKMRLRSERQQRLRFENMVQSSLHDLHLVLNMSSDGGDLTTVSFQFHAIETKLGEFEAQISEEHRSRVEQNRIFQQKLNEQDILLEQERKMIKTLSSKVEVQEEISREKAEEIKSLKNELGETQNELMGIKFAHGRGAEESRYAGALTSLVVAFQKEKTLRSSLTAKVRSLEQKSNCSILKEGQFENRVLDVERSLDSFSKFKESISAVVEKRLVHLNTDVEDLTENLTEAVKMTNDIQISIERLIKNVTKTEEDVKKIQAKDVALDGQCNPDSTRPCSDPEAVCAGVTNEIGTCTCRIGYTKNGFMCEAGRLTQEYKNQLKTWIGGGVDHFQLLYSATRDGCSASSFHQHCDNHGPTVTVIYQQQNGQDNVFGGYTSLSWTGNGDYRTDALAFLFVLRINGTENYISMPIIKIKYGIYDNRKFGPVFGGGHDLRTFRSRCNREESNQFYTDGYTHLWGFARNDNATAVFQFNRVKHLKSFSEQEVYKVT